jgi:hypothetical protein
MRQAGADCEGCSSRGCRLRTSTRATSDEACRIGPDALALADRQQVTTNLQACAGSGSTWKPWRDTQPVRELDEQLAAVTTA